VDPELSVSVDPGVVVDPEPLVDPDVDPGVVEAVVPDVVPVKALLPEVDGLELALLELEEFVAELVDKDEADSARCVDTVAPTSARSRVTRAT
jgi:hypothetical protein